MKLAAGVVFLPELAVEVGEDAAEHVDRRVFRDVLLDRFADFDESSELASERRVLDVRRVVEGCRIDAAQFPVTARSELDRPLDQSLGLLKSPLEQGKG